jgi:hypothetical protein
MLYTSHDVLGLRVGATAWKWPPVWPYDSTFFKRQVELDADNESKKAAGAAFGGMTSGMTSMMTGAAGAGAGAGAGDHGSSSTTETTTTTASTSTTFDSLKYWNDNSNTLTELPTSVTERLTNHYSYYLSDGMSILELGAAEQSYLPSNLQLTKHVGVGAVQSQMDNNPSITSSIVIDLNSVIDDVGLDSNEFDTLFTTTTTNTNDSEDNEDNRFDAVIMANTIEFLNHPREVFKSAYRALKDGQQSIMMMKSIMRIFAEVKIHDGKCYADYGTTWDDAGCKTTFPHPNYATLFFESQLYILTT